MDPTGEAENHEAERQAFLDKYGTWGAARARFAHTSEDVWTKRFA